MGLSSKQVSSNGEGWEQQSLLHATSMKQQLNQNQNQPKEPPLNCPRCDSMNTKFCYYNNYNKSQPRYYCKSCKRHWTKGGNLRNVPVGGNRRNKRLKTNNYHNSCEENKLVNKGVEEQNIFFGSNLPIPIPIPSSLPNFTFTDSTFFENTPSSISSSSSYFNGGIQVPEEGYECRGVVERVEDPCTSSTTSWQLPSSCGLVDSLCNWSWDEFNTLVSTDLNQPWDDLGIQEQGV